MTITEPQHTPPPCRRPWLQYSLGTLLVMLTLGAIMCSWLAVKRRQDQNTSRSDPIESQVTLEKLPFQVVDPPYEHEQAVSLREALIRHVMSQNTWVKVWFVDYSDRPCNYLRGSEGTICDPPDAFLARFKVPILKISKAWRKGGWYITDETGEVQGWVIHAQIVRWISPTKAEVECGAFHGLEAASGQSGTAELKGGKWGLTLNDGWDS